MVSQSLSSWTEPPLLTSQRLGVHLAATAHWQGQQCTWMGKVVAGQSTVAVRDQPCGADLYEGTAGIGLFLLTLAKATGDQQIMDVGHGAFRHALAHADADGFYEGMAGVAWAALRVCDASSAPEIASMARELAWRAADRALSYRRKARTIDALDLMSGQAGTLLALLAVARITGEASMLDACVLLGDELLAAASRTRLSLSWHRQPVGLAHGLSGIALSFLELFAVSQDQRYLRAAAEARCYENSLMHRDRAGLLTSRSDLDIVNRNSWCYGHHGIVPVRMRMYQLTAHPGIWAEICEINVRIQQDVSAVLRQPLQPLMHNSSLCHGLGGAIDALLLAFQATGQVSYSDAALHLAQRCRHIGVSQGSWMCGLPSGQECPGLMLGLAGIGAVFLRLHNPSLMQPLLALGSSLYF